MSDFKNDYYDEVDNAFADLRGHPFDEGDLFQPSPQERGIPLGPAGWVENADGEDGEAKVLINADGLTILDGRIFISDIGGASVLSAVGFDGAWVDFLMTGTHNGLLSSGSTDEITTNTLVGSASTVEDYEASLSTDIPYWVVESLNPAGGGTFRRVADSLASAGFALYWFGSVDASVFQDIPVVPGYVYTAILHIRVDNTGTWETAGQLSYSFRDKDHAIIGSQVNEGFIIDNTWTSSDYIPFQVSPTTEAPRNARYLRVEFSSTHTSGDAQVYLGGMEVGRTRLLTHLELFGTFPELEIALDTDDFPSTQIFAGGMSFGPGTSDLDTIIQRIEPGVLRLNTGHLVQQSSISPAQLTANVNNYAPTDGGKARMWRLSSDAARTITGIVPFGDQMGEAHILTNIGSQSILLAHQSASSDAANRFTLPGGVSYTIPAAGSVEIVYDGISDRWRVVSI